MNGKRDRYSENGGCHARIIVSLDYQKYQITERAQWIMGLPSWHLHNCSDNKGVDCKTVAALHDEETLNPTPEYTRQRSREDIEKEK